MNPLFSSISVELNSEVIDPKQECCTNRRSQSLERLLLSKYCTIGHKYVYLYREAILLKALFHRETDFFRINPLSCQKFKVCDKSLAFK